jgi:outer membrane protein OmpA-like peptidoglycan-associated protein
MDYSLYGRGELNIPLGTEDSNFVTRVKIPVSMENTTTPSDTLRLGDVFFDFSKANLKATALSMLRDYFGPGKKAPIDSIYIEGHTDSVGSDERNMQLSLRRCEAVQSWLTQNDIASRQNIQIRPFGESRPVASNSSAQGRAMNRRVELIIFQRQKK